MKKEDHIRNFSNPCWVSYLSPFTLIVPDGEEPLRVELEDINSNSYNHGKLCSIVSTFKINSFDYDLIICYDGALAIAKYGKFANKESVVDYFNSLFCKLLLGGVFSEAIDRRDIVNGRIYEKRAIWPVDFGHSASTYLHSRLRLRVGNNIDSIVLVLS